MMTFNENLHMPHFQTFHIPYTPDFPNENKLMINLNSIVAALLFQMIFLFCWFCSSQQFGLTYLGSEGEMTIKDRHHIQGGGLKSVLNSMQLFQFHPVSFNFLMSLGATLQL